MVPACEGAHGSDGHLDAGLPCEFMENALPCPGVRLIGTAWKLRDPEASPVIYDSGLGPGAAKRRAWRKELVQPLQGLVVILQIAFLKPEAGILQIPK